MAEHFMIVGNFYILFFVSEEQRDLVDDEVDILGEGGTTLDGHSQLLSMLYQIKSRHRSICLPVS